MRTILAAAAMTWSGTAVTADIQAEIAASIRGQAAAKAAAIDSPATPAGALQERVAAAVGHRFAPDPVAATRDPSRRRQRADGPDLQAHLVAIIVGRSM